MGTMVCSICGKYGLYWKNLGGLSPWTYCPHCGGTNCQVKADSFNDDEENESEDDE